ncbi:protein disulfide-isomerase precursor, partial [Kickxella alabastrina]
MKLDSLRVVRTMAAVTLAFTGLAAIVSAADAAKTAQAAVINLNSKNYKAWTATRGLALVEFYAPWCSYCQAMAPGYESAAADLKDDGIALAKVDCTKESEICDIHNIEGYPTLKVIDNGVFAAYNGTRQQNSIVEYMRKRKLPAVEEVTSKTFDKFTSSGHIVVVGFFDEKSAELETLKTVANELRDEYTFGYTTDKTLATKQGVAFPGLGIYKDFDTRKDEFEATTNVSLLRASVRSSSVPLMGELSAQTFVTYVRAGIPIGLVFYDSAESRKELESELLSLATRYRRWVSMALVDANVYRKHAKSINLKEKWPAFAIQDINKQFKYIHPQDKPLTKDTVGDFVADFFNDKLEPDYKTQVIFGPNDGGVYDLVASKFKEVVFDKSKDVLIEFYAP